MILNPKPEWVEPSFSVYYLDIVYSCPTVLEIDFLVIFKGALLSIEVEDRPTNIPRKSLKYFVNGVCRHPVIYSNINSSSDKDKTKCDTSWVLGINIAMPTLIDCSTIRDWLKNFLENNKRFIFQMKYERSQLFIIDNFMCALLIYSSPLICNTLIMKSNILKHVLNSFELARFRADLIKKVKILEERDYEGKFTNEGTCDLSSKNQTREKFQNIRSMIVIVPTVRSRYFYKELERFIKRKHSIKNLFPDLEKLVFVYTEESYKDAESIIQIVEGSVGNNVQVERRKVKKDKIGKTVKDLAICELTQDVFILTIGEVPKSELINLMDPIPNTKFGALVWRSQVYSDGLEKLIEKVLKCKEEKAGCEHKEVSREGGIEKIELQILEI